MNREIVLPTRLSVLSLAVALFVPLGVSMIADTSVDVGNQRNIANGGNKRFVPAEARGSSLQDQRKISYLNPRV